MASISAVPLRGPHRVVSASVRVRGTNAQHDAARRTWWDKEAALRGSGARTAIVASLEKALAETPAVRARIERPPWAAPLASTGEVAEAQLGLVGQGIEGRRRTTPLPSLHAQRFA